MTPFPDTSSPVRWVMQPIKFPWRPDFATVLPNDGLSYLSSSSLLVLTAPERIMENPGILYALLAD